MKAQRVWPRLLITLTLGLSLTLITLYLLGNIRLSAQTDPVSLSLLVPKPTDTDPAFNATNIPTDSNISITFDESINLASITTHTFAVYGSQSAIFTGTYSLGTLSRTATLDPARAFFPGERVDATVTTATLNITGEQVISSTTWQFWVAVDGGSGYFGTNGYSLGPGDSAADIALGDVDGDGSLDMIIGTSKYTSSAVYLNDGDGNPFDTISYSIGSADYGVTSLALGDIDGDGDLDLACKQELGSVYINDGNANPYDTISYTIDTNGYGVSLPTLGDVDGDGDLDLLVNIHNQPGVIYLNDRDENPYDTISHTIGSSADQTWKQALGDLDGDGDLDLAVGNYSQPNVIYLNDGETNPYDTISHTVGPGNDYTTSLALGDVDGDGDLDIVAGNNYEDLAGEQNILYLNDGDGTFDTIFYTIGIASDMTRDMVLGDLDGDGDLDLVVGNTNQQSIIYINDGDGNPFDTTFYAAGSSTDRIRRLALGDVDGDGDLDLAVGRWEQKSIIYLNFDHQRYLPIASWKAK